MWGLYGPNRFALWESVGTGTWYVRVEAILNAGAARFIVGTSNVVQVTVP